MQNYRVWQAIERTFQTFLGVKNCNSLGMNGLKNCLVQTFCWGKAKNHHLFHPIQKILREHFSVPDIHDVDNLLFFVETINEFDAFLNVNKSVN